MDTYKTADLFPGSRAYLLVITGIDTKHVDIHTAVCICICCVQIKPVCWQKLPVVLTAYMATELVSAMNSSTHHAIMTGQWGLVSEIYYTAAEDVIITHELFCRIIVVDFTN